MGVVRELLEAASKPRKAARRLKPWTETLMGAVDDHPVHTAHSIEDIQQAGDVLHYKMCNLPPSWLAGRTVFLDESHRESLFQHLLRNRGRILKKFFPRKSDDGSMTILPWQLMRIYVATRRFDFPQTVRVHGVIPTMGKKGISIDQKYSLPAGEIPMFQAIADGPGSGKTLTGIMIAAFYVLDRNTWRYVQKNKEYLLNRFYAWQEHGFVNGTPRSSTGPWGDPAVARVVVLTMKQTLADHWINHIVPFFKALEQHFGKKIHVWNGDGQEIVVREDGTWKWVRISELYKIHPEDPRSFLELAAWLQLPILLFENHLHQADAKVYTTAFLGRVFDEFDQKTLPQRGETAPNLLSTLVLNATMRNLTTSFHGNTTNPFRRYLGGSLPDADMQMEDVLPAQRPSLSKKTSEALTRSCLLRLMTGPDFLRDAATIGSRQYMPPELRIHFLYYRPTPKLLSTNAMNMQSLSQFLLSKLAYTSIVEVKEAMSAIAKRNDFTTGENLVLEINNLHATIQQNVLALGNQFSADAKAQEEALKLVEKTANEVKRAINQAAQDQFCCVCHCNFSEDLPEDQMRIASCCQGIYCSTCIARLSKCALCRTNMSTPVAINPPKPAILQLPQRPPTTIPECAVSRVVDLINAQVCTESVTLRNGIVTLISDHVTHCERPVRILLYFNELAVNSESQRCVSESIADATGATVKNLTGRYASHSEAVSLFKSIDPSPVVLLCGCSNQSQTISGLDFKTTTLMIFHGRINTSQAEQLRGRMMRVQKKKTTHAAQLVVTHELSIKQE